MCPCAPGLSLHQLIDIDNTASINVTNDVLVTANTGNDLEFHLGQNTAGSTASLDVNGNMTLDHNGAVINHVNWSRIGYPQCEMLQNVAKYQCLKNIKVLTWDIS